MPRRDTIRKRNKIINKLKERMPVKELAEIFRLPEATVYRITNKKDA